MTMGLSLVVEDSQKRWMSAITSWCVKSCPRNASGKRILHFSNRFGSASEQVEVDLAFFTLPTPECGIVVDLLGEAVQQILNGDYRVQTPIVAGIEHLLGTASKKNR